MRGDVCVVLPFFRLYLQPTRESSTCALYTRIYVTHCCEADLCVGGYARNNSSVSVCKGEIHTLTLLCARAFLFERFITAVQGVFELTGFTAES